MHKNIQTVGEGEPQAEEKFKDQIFLTVAISFYRFYMDWSGL